MAISYSRPSADTSLGHTVPSFIIFGGGTGYAQISEETSDGDSTYIFQTLSANSATVTSTFAMSAPVSLANRTVKSVKLAFVAKLNDQNTSGSCTATFKVNGSGSYTVSGTLTSSYQEFSASNAQMVAAMNATLAQGAVPTLSVQISTTGAISGNKSSSTAQIRITQIYVQIEYAYGDGRYNLLVKKGTSKFVLVTKMWKKYDGVWEEYTKEELMVTHDQFNWCRRKE